MMVDEVVGLHFGQGHAFGHSGGDIQDHKDCRRVGSEDDEVERRECELAGEGRQKLKVDVDVHSEASVASPDPVRTGSRMRCVERHDGRHYSVYGSHGHSSLVR